MRMADGSTMERSVFLLFVQDFVLNPNIIAFLRDLRVRVLVGCCVLLHAA
jgi:hypothetical protein